MTVTVNTQGSGVKATPLPQAITVTLNEHEWEDIRDFADRGADVYGEYGHPALTQLRNQIDNNARHSAQHSA